MVWCCVVWCSGVAMVMVWVWGGVMVWWCGVMQY